MNTQAKMPTHTPAPAPHWHESNPWSNKVVYVPIAELAAAVGDGRQVMDMTTSPPLQRLNTPDYVLAHWEAYGPDLDAYVLPQPGGQHCAGIRYGAEGAEYLSPWIEPAKAAELLERYADHPAPPPAPRPAPDHGREDALAWFASIVEMVDSLRTMERTDVEHVDDQLDQARTQIYESVLSVEVRSDWYVPGSGTGRADGQRAPAEYNILLSPGGPALRLVGDLSEHGEPTSARLEGQNWGTPWTPIARSQLAAHLYGPEATDAQDDAAYAYLLDFARQFYFGE